MFIAPVVEQKLAAQKEIRIEYLEPVCVARRGKEATVLRTLRAAAFSQVSGQTLNAITHISTHRRADRKMAAGIGVT